MIGRNHKGPMTNGMAAIDAAEVAMELGDFLLLYKSVLAPHVVNDLARAFGQLRIVSGK